MAADESVQGLADLSAVVGRFNVVNIKLDKCGGLSEGLAMARDRVATSDIALRRGKRAGYVAEMSCSRTERGFSA